MAEAASPISNNMALNPYKRPELTEIEKLSIYHFLLRNLQGGNLRQGAIKAAAEHGKCSTSTVKVIWERAKEQAAAGEMVSFKSRKKGVPKPRGTLKVDLNRVQSLSVLQRSSIRQMAGHLGMSKSTLHRCIKRKELKAHTNAIKPTLTEANKIGRLKFSLSNLLYDSASHAIKFQNMKNIVHIDEKWFFMSKTSHRYYMAPNEKEPYRHCQSKRFITKVMFLCAVARPHYSEDGALEWDGKIGIFPFTTLEPAMRGSKNRPKGTLETKPMQHVTKTIIKEYLITKVIPAIKEKWPKNCSKEIMIQQDNARPHLQIADQEFHMAASSDGFKITLLCQPPNSPDMNVNDLGFFNAIQSLQTTKAAKNVDELLNNVRSAFEELSAETLNKVFLTMQSIMIEVMKEKGGNNYKITHMNKDIRWRMGQLPTALTVERMLVKECLEYLQLKDIEMGSAYDFQQISNALGF